MNELQVFNNLEFGEVRFLEVEGKPYAVASDVAKVLGYTNPHKAIKDHCKNTQKICTNDSLGRQQEVNIVPESDIYRLIIKSKLPQAEKFEQWVMEEVLPQIRQTGGYVSNDNLFIDTYLPFADDTTKTLFKTTLETIRKQNELIVQQNHQIQQKQTIIDNVIDDKSLFAIGTVGKILKPYIKDMGAIKIFKFLRDNCILMDAEGTQRHNLPYDKYNKHFEMKCVESNFGTHTKTYFNGVGLKWFLNRLVKDGYLTSEQKEEVKDKF